MTREDLINQRATTCRHGGHCEWVACDKCSHYEPKPETITNSTSGYLEVVLPECSDCISRQAVLDKIYDVDGMEALENSNIFAKHYADMIKSLPSVTSKEKTERWISFGIQGEIDGQIVRAFTCSKCGAISIFRVSNENIVNGDLCPNCGCQMVKPQESEDKE